MRVLVVDNSDHRLAGGWFRECLGGCADVVVRDREDVRGWVGSWDGVILTGSERSVFEDHPWVAKQMSLVKDSYENDLPILGVCYGHQLIFRALYGKDVLARRAVPEVGWRRVQLEQDPVFADIPLIIYPYVFHHDELARIPTGWRLLASSGECAIHGARSEVKAVYGLQFHPEITPAVGVDGIRRQGVLLAGYGLDAEEIIASETPGGRRHYGEVVRRFVLMYCSHG